MGTGWFGPTPWLSHYTILPLCYCDGSTNASIVISALHLSLVHFPRRFGCSLLCVDESALPSVCFSSAQHVAHSTTGKCYLLVKTIERAHSPKHMWEKIKLSRNYEKVRNTTQHGGARVVPVIAIHTTRSLSHFLVPVIAIHTTRLQDVAALALRVISQT